MSETVQATAPNIVPYAAQREALVRFIGAGRAPQAVLLHGMCGIGKATVARAFAGAWLCDSRGEDGLACGRCRSCLWVTAGTHPDLRVLQLEEREAGKLAREISIEQVRALDDFTAMSAWGGRGRVVIIDPADALSVEAANALLKILEEPGARTVFVLVTHRPDVIAATVRSRTRALVVPPPAHDEAVAALVARTGAQARDAESWLAMTGGSVDHALEFADPSRAAALRALLDAIASLPEQPLVSAADAVLACGVVHWTQWLQRWVGDLLRVAAGAQAVYFPDRSTRLAVLARMAGPWRLAVAAERLARQSVLVDHPLNARLFLETTLALYRDAYR